MQRESVARILIVDDSADNRQSLAAIIQHIGHEPILADGGAEALRFLRSGIKVDLIITDVTMPQMSGLEFAEQARQARPDMPILFITGDDSSVDAIIASGNVALRKPYLVDRLMTVIAEALEPRAT